MNNRIFVTFDKSQEDIPTLMTFQENTFAYITGGPNITVLNVITGDRAIDIWNELSKKEKKNEQISGKI